MAKLSKAQVETLVNIRIYGHLMGARKPTVAALVKRGMIARVKPQSPYGREYTITREAFPHLPPGIPHTCKPVVTLWLRGATVEQGPHQHDTTNGGVYRFLRVVDGVPGGVGNDYRDLIERAGHGEHWSWGNAGFKTRTALQAETIAREVLGERFNFKGWMK